MKILRVPILVLAAVFLCRTALATSATYTVFYTFGSEGFSTNTADSSLDGSYAVQPPIEGSDGNFYGTTFGGGTNNDGTVYTLTPQGTITTLYSFQGYDGFNPRGQLFETNGVFYGTTQEGGINITTNDFCCGTAFTITPEGTLTTILNFSTTDSQGDTVDAGVVPSGTGFFYGTTYGGGSSNDDDSSTNATDSFGDVVQNPPGTVYKMTAEGDLTTLHGFSGADGANPGKEAVVGIDGSLYGTTLFGGPANAGTVFKITSAGTFTMLYAFTDGTDGAHPKAQLVQGRDGNFYGTTLDGGGPAGKKECSTFGCGTVFKITPEGTLTTLHDFTGSPEPAHPGSLTLGSDGNFYGTSYLGGKFFLGTIYTITPAGDVIVLHSFDATDGSEPIAGLTLASDGNFYGATTVGGAYNQGVIFKVEVDTNCTVTLSGTGVSLSAKGGTKSITVKGDNDCAWSATTTNSFIDITAGTSSLGDGKVTFTVLPNTNTVALSGAITIDGQTYPVNQAAGGCTFSLSPKSGKLKSTGGNATIKVKPKYTDCAWSAVSNDGFITITGGTNSVGSGAVSYFVPTNSTSMILTGSITVAGETFTVIQAGVKP